LAVKELPWCSPSDSPNRRIEKYRNVRLLRRDNPGENHNNDGENEDGVTDSLSLKPIDRFGIIVAMSKNGIIGWNGKLPWSLPDDRRQFVEKTKNKIMIIGRKTFQEQQDLSHVAHTSHTIIISNTLRMDERYSLPKFSDTELWIVPNFSRALHLARRLVPHDNKDHSTTKQQPLEISCWVAGGQTLYESALVHPSAVELHLTVVDTEVEFEAGDNVTFFPRKELWSSRFKLLKSDANVSDETKDPNALQFCTRVYGRINANEQRQESEPFAAG
jgi:dihydrofolate reductase